MEATDSDVRYAQVAVQEITAVLRQDPPQQPPRTLSPLLGQRAATPKARLVPADGPEDRYI